MSNELRNEISETPPPRFWWLKRIIIAYILFLGGLTCLWLMWSNIANTRLRATIARYRALGQPVLIEDFQTPPLPDDVNAAHYLLKAADHLTPQNPKSSYLRPRDRLPRNAEDFLHFPELLYWRNDDGERWFDANREAFSNFHHGVTLTDANWGVELRSPALQMELYSLYAQRDLAKLNVARGLLQLDKDQDEAASIFVDVLRQAQHVASPCVNLIEFLVGIAIERIVVDAIESHAAFGRVLDFSDQRNLRLLQQWLLDDVRKHELFKRAAAAERMVFLDTCLAFSRTRPDHMEMDNPFGAGWTPVGFVLRPMFLLDADAGAREISIGHGLHGAKRSGTLPRAIESIPADGWVRLLSSIMLPALGRAEVLFQKRNSRNRMAALALAIRGYRSDWGVWPSQLQELVPVYIPYLPQDSFREDLGVIRYVYDDDLPRLYSVGEDRRDDGGPLPIVEKSAWDRRLRVRRESADILFFVNGKPDAE